MGISAANAALLLAARAQGVRFGSVATLGVQTFWVGKRDLASLLSAFNSDSSSEQMVDAVGDSGSLFIKQLGGTEVIEFDASEYEGAQVIHDMNNQIPDVWRDRFDLVYDGGSLEHIFDVRQSLANVMAMVKVGGSFICSTTANNMLGHGFYQFSPEWFYRVFSAENGWQVRMVLLCEHQLTPPRFWVVEDPKSVGGRIEIQTREQVYVMLVATKERQAQEFMIPQQSDYEEVWRECAESKGDVGASERTPAVVSRILSGLERKFRRIRRKFHRRATLSRNSLRVNRVGIRRISLDELAAGDPDELSGHQAKRVS